MVAIARPEGDPGASERMRAVQDDPNLADPLRGVACCSKAIFNASTMLRTRTRVVRPERFLERIDTSASQRPPRIETLPVRMRD